MADRPGIILVGGTSTAGKTTLAEALARRLEARYIDLDLFRIVLQRFQPAHVSPELHLLEPDSIWSELTPEDLVERYLRVSACVCNAIEPLLAHHHNIHVPVVIEGAWLLPAFTVQTVFAEEHVGRPAAVFLCESSREMIDRRIRARPQGEWFDAQPKIAQHNGIEVQWLYGQKIKSQAEELGLPVLESTPFETLFDRALAALHLI